MPPLTFAELQEMIQEYVETMIPDGYTDGWDWVENRPVTYREDAQRTIKEFLFWLNQKHDDT
jgi:hypothetical protein